MTTSEDWSLQFDLLYNNISSNQAPGLTEYEKSVFLTQAQEAVILDLYKGTLGDSFETTEEVTRYLSSLVTENYLEDISNRVERLPMLGYILSTYNTPEDLWFLTYQSAAIEIQKNTKQVPVIPVKQDRLFKDLSNPFRKPNKNRVLSLSENNKITLYSEYAVGWFHVKYLRRPNPIVLENSELEVNGISEFNVEIPESLHTHVLTRAVQIAKAVWQS